MAAVKFKALTPNIIVNNVNAAVEFYTQDLGFTFITSVPETGNYNWGMVKRDNVTLMFQSLESLQEDLPSLNIKAKGSLGTFFIEVDEIDALFNSLKAKVKIASEMRTTFYGKREFTITDPDGYYLTFAEDVG